MKRCCILCIAIFVFCSTLQAQDYLIPYRKGALWGYANEQGEIIIEPKYSAVEPFTNSELAKIYSFINDTLYVGFASLYGNIAIPPNKYINVGTLKNASNRSSYYDADYIGQYVAYEKFLEKYFLGAKNSINNELLDSTNKVLLQNFDRLEIINKYQEGNFNILFRKNNKYGIMDYKGKMLLEPIYDYMYIDLADKYNPLLTIKNKGKIGIYSKDGKPIIPLALQYIYLDRYRNLYQKVILVNKNNFNSVYNTSGKLLFGPSKREILIESKIIDGKEKLLFSLSKETTENATIGDQIISMTEVRPVPPPAREAEPDRTEAKDGGSYIYTNSGFPIININGKNYTFFKQNNLMGIRDALDSNIVYMQPMYNNLDAEMDIITYKKIDIIKVRKDNKYGLIDFKGNILVPINYKSLYKIYGRFNTADPMLYAAENDKNKIGLIDIKNKIIIPFNYLAISKSDYHQNDSIFYVKNLKGNMGFIKTNLDYVIPEEYSVLLNIDFGYDADRDKNEGYFLAKNTLGKYGIINLNHKIELDFIYDSIVNASLFTDTKYRKDLAYYHFVNYKQGEYTMLDGKGKTIIPYTKEKINYLLNDKINEKEYYYVTTKKDEKNVVYTALYSTKNGLLYDYTKNDFFNMKYDNRYANGIIYFKDIYNKIGVVLNNGTKKIIVPKYNSINRYRDIERSLLKRNNSIEYFSLQYEENKRYYSDIINSNGVLFFED